MLAHFRRSAKPRRRDADATTPTRVSPYDEVTNRITAARGLMLTVRDADSIGAWPTARRRDDRTVFRAAEQASKVADRLLARCSEADASVARAA